jgi:hypothetical protein
MWQRRRSGLLPAGVALPRCARAVANAYRKWTVSLSGQRVCWCLVATRRKAWECNEKAQNPGYGGGSSTDQLRRVSARDEGLFPAGQGPGTAVDAACGTFGVEQSGQKADQFPRHVEHGRIGDHVESFWSTSFL